MHRMTTMRLSALKRLWLLVPLAALLGACEPHVLYHAYRSMPSCGWVHTDTLHFEVVLPDSASPFRFSVELRHRTTFPYRELPVRYTLIVPGRLPVCDTLLIPVADAEGNWFSEGWGDLRTTSSPVVTLPPGFGDTCRISLTSVLPDSLLPGVNDVGVKLSGTFISSRPVPHLSAGR